MREQAWVRKLVFALFALAGLAIVVTAVVSSGGNFGANITVRGSGDQTVPSVVVISVGIAILATGVAGFLWRRDSTL